MATGKQRQLVVASTVAAPPSSVSISPSSPRSSADSYGTDDSLEHQQRARTASAMKSSAGEGTRSPILVKYNYYDYNGERQENHELLLLAAQQNNNNNNGNSNNHASHKQQIQRQLSPTFRQNLDQILVRNGDKLRHDEENQRSAGAHHSTATMLLARRYNRSSYEHRCLRCKKTVYQMDKVGPLKDFSFYHQNCFKCFECGTKLTLKTYFNNQHSSTDLEVYCHRHCPKTPAGRLDNQSVGIRAALNAPKVFEPMAQLGPTAPFLPAEAVGPLAQGALDSRALHIAHAMRQTKLQAIYKQSQVDQKISQFLDRRLEFLEPKQKLLEMRHREEEEQLFRAFEQKWRQEEAHIREQIRDEWQLELNKLLEKYKLQLGELSSGAAKPLAAPMEQQQQQLLNQQPQQQLNLISKQQVAANIAAAAAAAARAAKRAPSSATSAPGAPLQLQRLRQTSDEQQMIELERMNLEKTMTIKLDRKKETLKRKLKEFERQATAELVEKQSCEMLALISLKLAEFKEEQKRKIGSDLEQFEALERLANQLDDSLQVGGSGGLSARNTSSARATATTDGRDKQEHQSASAIKQHHHHHHRYHQLSGGTSRPPEPKPPQVSKWQLYNSEQADEVFKDIDARAINIAQEDQQTFTELVHHLTRHCLTDIEKARAIFRWITVKNLNTMHFDPSIKADTPMGLLRGIKQGSESYHVLFKRLCSYAGLHCVVIKGYSKSAGYQPGVQFEGNRFRNSWNAVYVAGAWRFVQCNWGARHLVSVAVMQDKNSSSTNSDERHGTSTAAASPQAARAHGNNRHRNHHHNHQLSGGGGSGGLSSPAFSTTSSSSTNSSSSSSTGRQRQARHHEQTVKQQVPNANGSSQQADSLRYEYDDHYFLTDPDEFIYEFFPLASEWQLLTKSDRPITLNEFEQLPFVRSLFFKYGLYFPQPDIRSVLFTDSSGATTIKIGMPTHMIPNLIFHYNLKYFNSDQEQYDGISLKRFVMQSVESGLNGSPSPLGNNNSQQLQQQTECILSNIVSFRVHVPENGSYILDIFANSTTPTQYITGEPMKFKSVCKFKIIAKNLRTVMIPLPDCASGEYGPMKATRLFGIIPLTHENGLISILFDSNQDKQRLLEIQFRMTRPLLDFMASLHKNGSDERLLSKWIKIFIDGDIVSLTIKFQEDGQYGLDIYTRDQYQLNATTAIPSQNDENQPNVTNNVKQHVPEPRRQLLTHCCKYLINVRTTASAILTR